jgi:hypothetical protein
MLHLSYLFHWSNEEMNAIVNHVRAVAILKAQAAANALGEPFVVVKATKKEHEGKYFYRNKRFLQRYETYELQINPERK